MRDSALLVAILLAHVTVEAQTLTDYERVLLPVDPTVLVLGAQKYQARVSGCRLGDQSFRFFPALNGGEDVVPCGGDLGRVIRQSSIANGAGRFLYVSPNVDLQAWLHYGSEVFLDERDRIVGVPIVREAQFKSGASIFPRIEYRVTYSGELGSLQTHATHRLVLRIVAADGSTGAAVSVRQETFESYRHAIVERTVQLNHRNGHDASFPWYGETDLGVTLVGSGRGAPWVGSTIRVTITPLTRELRYWAYIAQTNNRTGEVAILTSG